MKALNRHVERVLNRDRKEQHWEKQKLARDRCGVVFWALLPRRLQPALQRICFLRIHRIICDDRFSLIALGTFEGSGIPTLRT
jgi:hypothetical protein